MRYETVESQFWAEPDFEGWSVGAHLLYLWAMTNPLGHGITGITKASPKQIKLQTGMSPIRQEAAFQEIGQRIRRYPGGWVWLCARFGHTCESPNHWKAAVNYLKDDSIPTDLVGDFWARYLGDRRLAVHHKEAPAKGLTRASGDIDIDSDSDSEPEPTPSPDLNREKIKSNRPNREPGGTRPPGYRSP